MKSRIGVLIGIFLLGFLWMSGRLPFGAPQEKTENIALSSPSLTGNHPPKLKRVSIIPGNPDLNDVLSVQTEVEDPDRNPVVFRYRWTVNSKVVGDTPILPLKKFKQTDRVSVEVTPSDGKIEGEAVQAAAVNIRNNPPTVRRIDLVPEHPKVGEAIQATAEGFDSDGDLIRYAYQWNINGKSIDGNDSDRLPAGIIRSNDVIAVVVTPSDLYTEGQAKASLMVAVKNTPPKILSLPPSGIEEGRFVYQMDSVDPDEDPLTYTLLDGPPGMVIDPKSGLLSWRVAALQEGKAAVAVVVDDEKGGRSEQRFTIRTGQ